MPCAGGSAPDPVCRDLPRPLGVTCRRAAESSRLGGGRRNPLLALAGMGTEQLSKVVACICPFPEVVYHASARQEFAFVLRHPCTELISERLHMPLHILA